MPESTLYDRLKAEGLEPPESVKRFYARPLTDREQEFGLALERALTEHADVWQALADNDKRATEDAQICTWVLVLAAQGHRAWERGYQGQIAEWAGKIGGYYVGEQARSMIEWWARKAILAFKMGAQ